MATHEQNLAQYRLEKKLAARIRDAAPEDRARVSLEAYDTLFKEVPWHPLNTEAEKTRSGIQDSYTSFFRIIGEGKNVLEIGCGNGDQMRLLAEKNLQCVGIDISQVLLEQQAPLPENLRLMVGDAIDLSALEDSTFDVVFSGQLVEHLHPDDLADHLRETARVLRPGGCYICLTPNRLSGPHDISRTFDDVATCFHLKEYTHGELMAVMRKAGFRKFWSPLFANRMYQVMPLIARLTEAPTALRVPVEKIVGLLPRSLRRKATKWLRLSRVFIVATR